MKNIEFKVASSSCCTPRVPLNTKETVKEEYVPDNRNLPVAIIGAGPIGLAAAAHLAERGQPFILFEAGPSIGQNILQWGHVRLFSPWQYNIDKAAERLLRKQGRQPPVLTELPFGQEIVNQYLRPLAQLPELEPYIMLNAKVVSISKKNADKMKSANRAAASFVLYVERNGNTERLEARAVIDASGTWGHSNPLNADGIWTREERDLKDHIYYGIPDLSAEQRQKYAGKRVAVVGGGHSAINTLLDLAKLKETDPTTEIIWVMRKKSVDEAYGGEENDQLEARGALGSHIHQLIDAGQIQVVTPFLIEGLSKHDGRMNIKGAANGEGKEIQGIDEIIVNTGSRPDFSFLSEIRLSIDPATESVEALAPLIDPNVHSCGTVRPHGEKELRHLDKNFYLVGMKSYGRAPTFLMATGYEQVRSIAAYLDGDLESALKVELELPETGVCGINSAPNANDCCMPAASSTSGCN
ncbi:NAD(P)-binding domain-containing protein [Paenibacillus lautus]|uniref:NAD(P)-binding domain-containing protein n=1 Tax=Paenibacillus lautus TaxID=1401 RepID=UPI002DBF41EF|nr:NAD(P)-binding domain-containing protein [Paenibacillus lautus]MEC0306388.1 NAD(P)-binding domain-containing protein [Paenibacillus lautus]